MPDLPAMALWPSDLPEQGYGFMSAWRLSVHDLAVWNAPSSDKVAVQEQQFTAYGVQATWAETLGLPSTPSDPASDTSKEIQIYLVAFDSAEHAHLGYKLIVQDALAAGATPDSTAVTLGDEARSVTITVSDPNGNGPDVQYRDVYDRTGTIAVDLRLRATQPAPAPTLAQAQALGKMLLTRIAAVLNSGGPGLSQHALGLDVPENPPVTPSIAAYERLNGKELPLYGLSAAQIHARDARFGAAIDVYQQTQSPTADLAGPAFNARLYRFASAADAKAWLAGQDYFKGINPTQLVQRKNAPKLGDQSTEYTFDTSAGSTVTHNVAVLFLSGSLAVSVAVSQPGTQPSIASVEKLATRQARSRRSPAPPAPPPRPSWRPRPRAVDGPSLNASAA